MARARTRVTPRITSQFVSAEAPALYTPVTMKTHMETTMQNLALGRGAWDVDRQESTTATYVYTQPMGGTK